MKHIEELCPQCWPHPGYPWCRCWHDHPGHLQLPRQCGEFPSKSTTPQVRDSLLYPQKPKHGEWACCAAFPRAWGQAGALQGRSCASCTGVSCSLPLPITPRCPHTLCPPDPHAWIPHALPTSTVLAVAAVGLSSCLQAAGLPSGKVPAEGDAQGSSTLTAHRWKPQTMAKSHVSTTSSLGGSHAPVSGGIPPLHFPLGYRKSLPVHQGQVSLQHLMSCFFLACRVWLLPAQGTWQHASAPRDKALLLGGFLPHQLRPQAAFPLLQPLLLSFLQFLFSVISASRTTQSTSQQRKLSLCFLALLGKIFYSSF
nr:uncharacterized protein LOC113845395 isoform X2 [Anas platyrhynchos]